MANWVKVATVSPSQPHVDPDISPQALTDFMIEHLTGKIQQVLPDRPDLIVLRECCDRPEDFPFEKRTEYYRYRKDKIRDAVAELADKNNCYIVYSAYREADDGSFRNSSQVLDRNGEVCGVYNKNHLVVEETTRAGVLAGKDAPLIQCDFGTIACLICFDLNFDELRLKYVQAKPDLLVFSSMYHGGLMQTYWAYSCRAHFVGAVAALPGEIRNPFGEVIATTTNYHDYAVASINLDCEIAHLDYNWSKLDALKTKYGSKVSIHDPGLLAPVLISSEHETVSAADMVKEFEIELLDDYMARAMDHRRANMEP